MDTGTINARKGRETLFISSNYSNYGNVSFCFKSTRLIGSQFLFCVGHKLQKVVFWSREDISRDSLSFLSGKALALTREQKWRRLVQEWRWRYRRLEEGSGDWRITSR